jgi:hypothetical protein
MHGHALGDFEDAPYLGTRSSDVLKIIAEGRKGHPYVLCNLLTSFSSPHIIYFKKITTVFFLLDL